MLKGDVNSWFANESDTALFVANGQNLLNRIECHGCGLVRVAMKKGFVKVQVWRMKSLHDLCLQFVRNPFNKISSVKELMPLILMKINVIMCPYSKRKVWTTNIAFHGWHCSNEHKIIQQ